MTVRGGGWDEVFLLLFHEVLSVRFWVTASGFRKLCTDVTHPPPPLQRGELRCVTVRGVGWDEVFLLLFGEVVSVRFWVTALGIGGCART